MVLGISGSPRIDGITAHAVKEILSNINGETQYVSLSGKKIAGCISCLGCVGDNHCVIQDDFIQIAEQLRDADAIVLGVPNYYNMPNALTHCLLERCFCFRHEGDFALKDKPIIIVSTGYSQDEENSQTLRLTERFAKSNLMNVVGKFLVGPYSQCYDCPSGRTCLYGNVYADHGLVDEITADMLPLTLDKQPVSIAKCHNAAMQLNRILEG